MNPFIYDSLALGGSFCGRETEIKTITGYLENGRNVLLYSKRRFGKTSLVMEIFKNWLDSEKFIPVYADIFDIVQPLDFPRIFSKAVADSLDFDIKEKLTLLKDVFTRVTFTGKLSGTGEFEITPSLAEKDYEALMDDVFASLPAIAQRRGKKLVLAIDEFQQISLIKDKKIDALMRKYIQQRADVSYIFTGSKKHILNGLFSEPSAPLYEMASHLELGPIEESTFYDYAAARMNKEFSGEVFAYLYEKAGREPKTIQNVCYHLFESAAAVTKESVDAVFEKLVREKDGMFRMIFDNFSRNQKAALKMIAACNGEDIFSQAALSEYGISKSSLNSAVNMLVEKDILYRDSGRYFISDRLFEMWCAS